VAVCTDDFDIPAYCDNRFKQISCGVSNLIPKFPNVSSERIHRVCCHYLLRNKLVFRNIFTS
jgi:hypothetical protein